MTEIKETTNSKKASHLSDATTREIVQEYEKRREDCRVQMNKAILSFIQGDKLAVPHT